MYPLLHASVLDDTRKVYVVGSLHGFLVSFRKRQSTTLDEDKHRVFAVPNRMAASSLAYPFALHGLAACTPPHYTPESLLYSAQSRQISLLYSFCCPLSLTPFLVFCILLSNICEQHGSNYCCLRSSCYLSPPIRSLEKVPAAYAKNGDNPEGRCPRHVRIRRYTDHRRHDD